ncbi:cytochrome P450, partial [Streptomyces sp. NPDC049099]|uniref:cytochrome P450 n=1 Tax=Streptomyces sp. NPDC049099 TaxID=3155768 RepID=UPI00341DD1BD
MERIERVLDVLGAIVRPVAEQGVAEHPLQRAPHLRRLVRADRRQGTPDTPDAPRRVVTGRRRPAQGGQGGPQFGRKVVADPFGDRGLDADVTGQHQKVDVLPVEAGPGGFSTLRSCSARHSKSPTPVSLSSSGCSSSARRTSSQPRPAEPPFREPAPRADGAGPPGPDPAARRDRRDTALHPPVQLVPRQAERDAVFAGNTVPAGATVFRLIGAANRDPDAFAAPDTFDIPHPDPATARSFTAAAQHLAFGSGLHQCVGAAFARAAIETVAPRCSSPCSTSSATLPGSPTGRPACTPAAAPPSAWTSP